MTPRSREEDVEFGRQNELSIKSFLEQFLGCQLTKHPDTYWPMDFHSPDEKIWCETKRRFVEHDRYPTAIIGKYKIDFCDAHPEAAHYFTWQYEDGVYYIKYDPALFATFEQRMYRRNDRVDHSQALAMHYFIPHDALKLMRVGGKKIFPKRKVA